MSTQNNLHTIKVYEHNGVWVFDDDRFGLVREPFVAGMTEIINFLVSDIPNAKNGFNLLFSAEPFPGYKMVLDWATTQYGGNWYNCKQYNISGWLCPAMYHYFDTAPVNIYVQAIMIEDKDNVA